METERTRHSRYNIHYHLVWIPKYRRHALDGQVGERMTVIFHEIAKDKGLRIEALEVMPDHVHLFVSAPPMLAPSLLVNWFKGISARLYNHRFGKPKVRWTEAYYVGTAGNVSAETIRRYIEEQKSRPEGD